MKNHYDICVAGFWFGSNYGSLLNGYAEYCLLKKEFGKEVLMLQKPGVVSSDSEISQGHNTRFVKKYYEPEDISPVMPYSDLKKLNDICDCFCAGSDQIWNYNLSFHENMYLPFVSGDKKIISFATSFGHKNDKTPDDAKPRIRSYLQRYSTISVREQFDVDILRDNYGINSTLVFEPVFCIDKKHYYEMVKKSELSIEKPYLLTYILDPTPEKREAILYYAEKLGLQTINILSGYPGSWERNRDALNLPGTLADVGAEDFLKAFMNADYVITDSFHGTAFSIIFNKPFLSIGNYGRGYERFIDLLGRLKLEDRLVVNPKSIPHDEKYLKPIDYTITNQIIEAEAQKTVEWFRNAVETPKSKMPSILIYKPDRAVTSKVNNQDCIGCGACVSSCPKDALSLTPDKYGYYCATINAGLCVNCGACSKVCPALELPVNENTIEPKCYACIAADPEEVVSSSSGGASSVFALEAINRKGIVVGAAWKDDFSVEHVFIENQEELYKIRKSKYLQSYLGDTFRKVKSYLDEGRFILFTGCPCQVAGLKKYLNKEYDNLITIDILCTTAPSPLFFKKYIEDSFPQGLEIYTFRHKDKKHPWDCFTINAIDTNGVQVTRHGGKEDDYQRVFHSHIMTSHHCEYCKYQGAKRAGDLTLGDFWGIKKYAPEIRSKNGVSFVGINNKKGQDFFESIPQNEFSLIQSASYDWLDGNGLTMNQKNHASKARDDFYKVILTMPFSKAVDYAMKPNHGEYPGALNKHLLFSSSLNCQFSFDRNVWEQHIINDKIVLVTRQRKPSTGKYAVLPLNNHLIKGKEYLCKLRFMIRTEFAVYNFHVKDSGSNIWQIILSHKINAEENGAWIEKEFVFTPNADFYDEFMIGAAQLQGNDAYIAFDHISIVEK